MKDRTRPATALIGAGQLARAFLPALLEAGYPVVGVAARRAASARAALGGRGGILATSDPSRAAREARLVLLAVPDPALREIGLRLARGPVSSWKGRTVLHHAGALGPEPLEALARRGAAVGVLHPLQCLGSGTRASESLAGSRARIEGDPAARRTARELAGALGLIPLRRRRAAWSPEERTAYHCAASLVSNDLVALLEVGIALLQGAGLGRRAAMEALGPLVRGTVEQAGAEGIAKALSGPAVRGDDETLTRHLNLLHSLSADAAEVHRLLSRALLRLAEREGRSFAPAVRKRLDRLLATPRPRAPRRSGL